MTKVHGKRYAYKFDFHGLMIACQAQGQGTGNEAPVGYSKYHTHQNELGAVFYAPGTKLSQTGSLSQTVTWRSMISKTFQ